VTINTFGTSFDDSTVSFSTYSCIVFRAHKCITGAVALTTTTSSYTTDAYVLYLSAPDATPFGGNIYAKCVTL